MARGTPVAFPTIPRFNYIPPLLTSLGDTWQVPPYDPIHWDAASRRCVSALRPGAVVRWAFSWERERRLHRKIRPGASTEDLADNGQPVDRPECCNVITMNAARWFELLYDDGEYDAGIGFDVGEVG